MFNSFPVDKWDETVTDFWTWGGHNSTGTYIQLALGFILMVVALVAWVVMEKGKLDRQAAVLRASGMLDTPPAPDSTAAG